MQWIVKHAELIGTLASICVVLSFLQTGERRIRLFNIVGAAIFVVYGLIIQAHSVWVVNLILIGVQVFRVYKLRKQTKYQVPKSVYSYNNKQFQNILEEVKKR